MPQNSPAMNNPAMFFQPNLLDNPFGVGTAAGNVFPALNEAFRMTGAFVPDFFKDPVSLLGMSQLQPGAMMPGGGAMGGAAGGATGGAMAPPPGLMSQTGGAGGGFGAGGFNGGSAAIPILRALAGMGVGQGGAMQGNGVLPPVISDPSLVSPNPQTPQGPGGPQDLSFLENWTPPQDATQGPGAVAANAQSLQFFNLLRQMNGLEPIKASPEIVGGGGMMMGGGR